MKRFTYIIATMISCLILMLAVSSVSAQDSTLKVGWSIYPGWMDNALMGMKLRRGKQKEASP